MASPTLEGMQPLGRRVLIEPKEGTTMVLVGFLCLWFHWPVQLFSFLLGRLPAPSASALYKRQPLWKV